MKYLLVFCSIFYFCAVSALEETYMGSEDRVASLSKEVEGFRREITAISEDYEAKYQKSYSEMYTKILDLEARLRDVLGQIQQVEYTNK